VAAQPSTHHRVPNEYAPYGGLSLWRGFPVPHEALRADLIFRVLSDSICLRVPHSLKIRPGARPSYARGIVKALGLPREEMGLRILVAAFRSYLRNSAGKGLRSV